ENPKSIFVAEFLNLDIDTPAINLICGEHLAQELKEMIIGVRPEDVEVFEEKKGDCIMGTIVDMRNIPLRNATILRIRIDTNEVYVRIPLKKGPSVNRRVWLSFRKYHIFDKNSGQRLRSYRNSQSP
ncbi:hypothetical protein KAS10_02150, partial [Candidatus Aerophobetes bacterium]|nr:hypothetical protein [Candidatus Aerophobetes bacterium]